MSAEKPVIRFVEIGVDEPWENIGGIAIVLDDDAWFAIAYKPAQGPWLDIDGHVMQPACVWLIQHDVDIDDLCAAKKAERLIAMRNSTANLRGAAILNSLKEATNA